jgi:hypothetical protein
MTGSTGRALTGGKYGSGVRRDKTQLDRNGDGKGVTAMLVLKQMLAAEESRVDEVHRKMFRVMALRNRQVGIWAALMMEMDPKQAEKYANEVIALGLQKGGDLAIVAKLTEDFAEAGVPVSPEGVYLEMARRTLSAESTLNSLGDLPRAA